MNATYKVVFFYPDRHIEEVDEIFYFEEKAKEYGQQLLGQVVNTEGYLGKHRDGDGIFHRKKAKPSFMVIEIGGDKKYTVVFDSKE